MQPIVPEISCRAKGMRSHQQQGLITICRAQLTLSLSTAPQSPSGLENWDLGGKRGRQGVGQPVPNTGKAWPVSTASQKKQGWESRSSPWARGSRAKLAAPKSVSSFPKIPELGAVTPIYLLCSGSTDRQAQRNGTGASPAFPNPPPTAFLSPRQSRGNFLLKCHQSLPGLELHKVRKGIRGILIQNLLQTEGSQGVPAVFPLIRNYPDIFRPGES